MASTKSTEDGGERTDNFVDAAFAFVITLLVVSGTDIPHDIPTLLAALGEVPAFAAAFAQLGLFWHGHVKWRETVGVNDLPSLLLSLLLVFFALIFVYPLHMVFSSFLEFLSAGLLPSDFEASSLYDLKVLFIVYGVTFACMAATLTWLFQHATRAARHLGPRQRMDAALNAVDWGYCACVGLLSAIVALLIPADAPPWTISAAGCTYFLLWFTGVVHKRWQRRLERRLPAAD